MGIPINNSDGLLTKNELEKLRTLTINDYGLGDIKLGMTIEQASEILGFDIKKTRFKYGSKTCYSYALSTGEYNRDGVRFLTDGKIIDTIDVHDHLIKTNKGLSIGQPMQAVKDVYGDKLKIFPSYEWPEHDLVKFTKEKALLIFKGPLFTEKVLKSSYFNESVQKNIKQNIRIISIGFKKVGGVEGCL
jgi:hypothetical protein